MRKNELIGAVKFETYPPGRSMVWYAISLVFGPQGIHSTGKLIANLKLISLGGAGRFVALVAQSR
jgi:hypothetical protein